MIIILSRISSTLINGIDNSSKTVKFRNSFSRHRESLRQCSYTEMAIVWSEVWWHFAEQLSRQSAPQSLSIPLTELQ